MTTTLLESVPALLGHASWEAAAAASLPEGYDVPTIAIRWRDAVGEAITARWPDLILTGQAVRGPLDPVELLDVVGSVDFWGIVADHEMPDEPEPRDAFRAELGAAMMSGSPAVWQRGPVTVTMVRHSRVNAEYWPQVGSVIRITSPLGEDVIDGDDVTGWTDLWERVETVLDQCARSADLAVAAARSARARLDALERQVTAARRERDCAIQDAHSLGVPIARLVEVTGIQRAMVHRIATRSTVSGSSPGAGMSHGGSNS